MNSIKWKKVEKKLKIKFLFLDEINKLIVLEIKKRRKKRKVTSISNNEEEEEKERAEIKSNFKLMKVELPIKIELKYMNDLKNAIKRELDFYLLRYDDELKGVIISYKDIELVKNISNISYNPSDTHLKFSIRVNILLFCPTPDSTLSGIVNHVSCFYFYFKLQKDW